MIARVRRIEHSQRAPTASPNVALYIGSVRVPGKISF